MARRQSLRARHARRLRDRDSPVKRSLQSGGRGRDFLPTVTLPGSRPRRLDSFLHFESAPGRERLKSSAGGRKIALLLKIALAFLS